MESSEKQYFRKVAFGERLAQARIRLKLSQEVLAEAVGTTARSISRWEHNQAIPQQYYRERLCEALQTTPEALFAENDEKQQGAEKQTPLWHVPYPRNPYFTGREDILYQLHERLHQEHRIALTQPQIMSGLGGIGKTQTALEYLYRFRDDYQTILWVGAETPEILISDYRMLAHLFQLPEKDGSNHILLREAVKRWFHSHANWLLVFDNVEDMEQLHIMLPDTHQGHILITTRSQIAGSLGFHIDLQKMEPAEGAMFLLRRAKLLQANVALEDASPSLLAQANTLVELLDSLPLALDQAGAYIEETACTLSDYLERYTTRRTVLLSTRGTLSNHHPDSVTTTLALAIQQVEQRSPAVADLLRVCAFLHAEAIPEEFFLNAGEALGPALQSLSAAPIELDAAIKELRRFSLLHRESATKTFHIHRLLQVIIKDRSDGCEQKMWIQRVTQAMLQIFPDPKDVVTFNIENQSDYQRYLSHALICARSLKEWNIASVEVEIFLYRLAKYLKRLGDFVQATDLILQILAISREMFGEEHPRSVPYLNEIAFIYMDARRFYEAEKYFRAALALCEKDSSEAAECFWGLANLLYYQGKYTQAKSFAQQALAIQEQALGSRQSEIAYSLTVLGRVYFLSREYAQAELLFQKALNMYEETMPEAHISVASCLKQLCKLYTLQGDWSEATRSGQRALQIYEENFGSHHPNIANIENALGHLYFCQNRYSEAETSFNRAWMIYEKHPEQDGLDKVLPLLGLGELYIVQNRLSLAQYCLQRVYSMLEQTLQGNSVDHQDIICCLLAVGDHFALQDDLIQTQACYLQAMNIGVQQFGSDHPLTLQCQSKLEAIFVILDQG